MRDKPMKPLSHNGGFLGSRNWIPLVRSNGYTTSGEANNPDEDGNNEPNNESQEITSADS